MCILAVTCYKINTVVRLQYCTLIDFDDDSDVEVEKDDDERSQQEGTTLKINVLFFGNVLSSDRNCRENGPAAICQ